MRIVVFKNGHKKEDKHPDYIIYRSEEGKDLEKIGALWLGKSSKGQSYMSGSIEFEDAAPENYRKEEQPKVSRGEDDQIPF